MSDDSPTGDAQAERPAHRPLLRVVRGDATAEEVAALVAVVASLGAPAALPRRRPPEWSSPRRGLRSTPPHGPGGWRSSHLPR